MDSLRLFAVREENAGSGVLQPESHRWSKPFLPRGLPRWLHVISIRPSAKTSSNVPMNRLSDDQSTMANATWR